MTSKQRAYLKGLAMTQDAILQIGKSSLMPEVTASVAEALEARELVKINVLQNCMDDPRALAQMLAERTRSQVVQVIGKKIGYKPRVVFLTPQGKVFNQEMAKDFAREKDLVFLCGHYEGIDERVLEEIVTDYVSIGDYVLTGGELPAMVMMDSISRMVPGVLTNQESGETESFSGSLLEYPQYSRPETWHGKQVPPVLLSGHHANVDAWRREQSVYRTAKWRPDLLKKADLTNKEWNQIRQWRKEWKEAEEKE